LIEVESDWMQRVSWSVWSAWSVWLNETNQMHPTDESDQMNQRNHKRRGLALPCRSARLGTINQ